MKKNRPVPVYSFGAIAQRGKLFTILCALALSISACGGGGGGSSTSTPPPPPPPPAQYTISGSVSALAGVGLVLQDNGGDNLAVTANGNFTFKTSVTSGGAYAVTVAVQPLNPGQNCEVTNGTGTATANVTNVQVDCGHGEWTWMGGSDLANQKGIYGTKGTAATTNGPGGRTDASSWVDKSGNVWLFGGSGLDSAGTNSGLNDLWKYSSSNSEWTWMGGSDLANQPGAYGTKGTASSTNIPGARNDAVIWQDASGNVWLFGGLGLDSAGTGGDLNDLWKYSDGQWTWMGGSNVVNQTGIYGTEGTPSATNMPGSRDGYDASWTDASGNFWIFGGAGYDYAGVNNNLSDLWEYSPSSGEWTWMGGSEKAAQAGSYGTLGTPSTKNIPGARWAPAVWTDSSGNVWIFGGSGFDSGGHQGNLNDLWKYSPGTGEWTWMGGYDVYNKPGVYGTEGTPSTNNIPGARLGGVVWTDSAGNFWLFGGYGYDSVGTLGELNDLWRYSPASGEWTWMSGSELANELGTYGTMGTPYPGNVPGARTLTVGWINAQGNLCLFGGGNYAGTTLFNDLWCYEP